MLHAPLGEHSARGVPSAPLKPRVTLRALGGGCKKAAKGPGASLELVAAREEGVSRPAAARERDPHGHGLFRTWGPPQHTHTHPGALQGLARAGFGWGEASRVCGPLFLARPRQREGPIYRSNAPRSLRQWNPACVTRTDIPGPLAPPPRAPRLAPPPAGTAPPPAALYGQSAPGRVRQRRPRPSPCVTERLRPGSGRPGEPQWQAGAARLAPLARSGVRDSGAGTQAGTGLLRGAAGPCQGELQPATRVGR